MDIFKKYLLNTAARFAPPDEGGSDAGASDGASTSQDGGADAGGDASSAAGTADEGEAGDGAASGDSGDEDPYAGLTPEQKAKIARRVQEEVDRETSWRDRQIDRLHRQKREAQEDNKTLTSIATRQTGGAAAAAPGADAAAMTQEQIRVAAAQLAAQERYNEGLIEADASGRKHYEGDWKKATDKLAKMGGVSPEDMQAILTTDNPAVVLFTLSDPEEYERVMALSGAKRSNAFVKLGLKAPPTRKKAAGDVREDLRPGGSPPPPRTLQGSRGVAAQAVNIYDDKVDDDAWFAERNKTRRKKFSEV